MKKVFLVISVAALALTACTSESVEYVGSGPEAKQIAFSPVSQPNTRGQYAITTTSFPDDNTMEVKCYQSAPTPAAAYFGKTTFSKGTGTTYWGGNPAQYWPLSAATLNFFAVSGYGLRASDITIADALASSTVAYTTANSYSATTQSDIMYAFGRGAVTQVSNTLSFNGGNPVDMVFKHALALVDFQVKGDGSTEATAITVNSITLSGATYNGTLTLTNSAPAAQSSGAVTTTVSWAPGSSVPSVLVPGISSGTTIYSDAYHRIGNGLMVIPGTGFDSFTINYSMNGNSYDYTYTPATAITSTVASTKYTFEINFTLHEILIIPSITEWEDHDFDDSAAGQQNQPVNVQ